MGFLAKINAGCRETNEGCPYLHELPAGAHKPPCMFKGKHQSENKCNRRSSCIYAHRIPSPTPHTTPTGSVQQEMDMDQTTTVNTASANTAHTGAQRQSPATWQPNPTPSTSSIQLIAPAIEVIDRLTIVQENQLLRQHTLLQADCNQHKSHAARRRLETSWRTHLCYMCWARALINQASLQR
jgi:hypothetical protein